MILYLLRHGIALAIGEGGTTCDEERMLSKKGRERTAAVAHGLRVLGCRPEAIYSSPLVRAEETAAIVTEILESHPPVRIADVLAAGARLTSVLKWLRGRREGSAMLVGHMPDMAVLAAALASPSGDTGILLKKAAVCRLSFPDTPVSGEGILEWLLQPAALRKLAESATGA